MLCTNPDGVETTQGVGVMSNPMAKGTSMCGLARVRARARVRVRVRARVRVRDRVRARVRVSSP